MKDDSVIFVTGFPGFIAGRLIARLAAAGGEFVLLTQPEFRAKAEADLHAIARENGVAHDRFRLIEGDITLPGLGIAEEERSELLNKVTDIFHLAAVYDLAVDRELAYAVNLNGTKNVNEFAASAPRLRRYNYISTCYVAGKRTGLILETELQHDAGFRNHYEETKYLAEIEVEKLKATLPITIFRPSVVVGDSVTGETAKYDGIYYLIQYLLRSPGLLRLVNVGNAQVRLNLVPVDFVVDGIAALSDDDKALGQTIALADPNPMTTSALFDLIAENLAGKPALITPPASLVEIFLRSPISPATTGLPHSGVPYFFIEQSYDTSIADQLLRPDGISCPPFSSYVSTLVDFVKKHPSL